MWEQEVAFWIIAVAMALAAIGVVRSNNVVHAALYLVVVLAGMARAFEGWPSLHVSPRIWIALVWMGIAASGIGFVLFNRSVTENGPTRTSAFVYGLVPLFVALLGWILFREIPGPSAIVATVLVLAGLAWTARDGR